MEEAVTFENKKGEKIFGIVHTPDLTPFGEKKVGVNLLDPGIKYRVAPNRLNIKLARRLSQNGYYVLRFDPAGIGDSEGELPENVLVPDIWEKIQRGLFINDTIASNDFFTRKYELDELILIGNCGGAITALLTAAEDARVNALCLIDIPINLRTPNMTFADKVLEGGEKADWLFSEYIKRFFRPKSLYRVVTFRTNFKALWKVFRLKAQKKINLFSKDTNLPKNFKELCREKKLNRLFFESFETFISDRKPFLFVLAGSDPGTEVFQHYFQNDYLREKYQHSNFDELVEIFLIDNANHVYTLLEWQESLINKVYTWVYTQSPVK